MPLCIIVWPPYPCAADYVGRVVCLHGGSRGVSSAVVADGVVVVSALVLLPWRVQLAARTL